MPLTLIIQVVMLEPSIWLFLLETPINTVSFGSRRAVLYDTFLLQAASYVHLFVAMLVKNDMLQVIYDSHHFRSNLGQETSFQGRRG